MNDVLLNRLTESRARADRHKINSSFWCGVSIVLLVWVIVSSLCFRWALDERRDDIARLTYCQDVARAFVEQRVDLDALREAVLATVPAER